MNSPYGFKELFNPDYQDNQILFLTCSVLVSDNDSLVREDGDTSSVLSNRSVPGGVGAGVGAGAREGGTTQQHADP